MVKPTSAVEPRTNQAMDDTQTLPKMSSFFDCSTVSLVESQGNGLRNCA